MSNCSNCYNGCTEIVSDRCIKYTGIDVPVLGIQTGDSLSYIEQSLITFLTSTLDGTGIKPVINPQIICDLVNSYLPTCGDISSVDLFNALIKSACDLQTQVDAIDVTLATLNADYTVDCLTGVTASSDTHAIVQAVITKLCDVEVNLVALALELNTNYSSNGTELDNYIANYLATNSGSVDLISNRMVPWSVVPYFGPLSNFSSTGVGLGDWANIYLCNGANGTPDLRGRVPVGVTAVPGGGSYSPQVDPGLGNPNYTLNLALGANGITLTTAQLPAHAHPGSSASTTVAPHSHLMVGLNDSSGLTSATPIANAHSTGGNFGYDLAGSTIAATVGKTSDVSLSPTTNVTIASQGAGESHANFQPGLGCYYIQYRPV